MKDVLWLTRVSETLSEAQRLVGETGQDRTQELKPGYFGKEVSLTYAGIEQRWLLVYPETVYQTGGDSPTSSPQRVHSGNCPVLITLFGQARVPGHHYVIYITCALRSLAVSLTRNLKPDP